MGCVAFLFAAPAAWIFWMVRKFADGDGWFEFTVRLVLDELIIAVGSFAAVLLIWGVFAPQRLAPVVDWAARHTAQVVFLVAALLFGSPRPDPLSADRAPIWPVLVPSALRDANRPNRLSRNDSRSAPLDTS